MKWRRLYKAHIASEEWRATKLWVKAYYGYRCVVCNSTHRLQVHHKSYENFGNEPLSDLELVCEKCHVALHALHKENKPSLSLELATEAYRIVKERPNVSQRRNPIHLGRGASISGGVAGTSAALLGEHSGVCPVRRDRAD